MGSILLLRRPAILTSAPVHSMVTITKTCLFGIYSPNETSQDQVKPQVLQVVGIKTNN